MPFTATVIPVMIASPSDVQGYRAAVREVLHEWNYIHADSLQVVLMPVGWETHSSPELGARPQDLINDRVLQDCDLLVGIFWTRLGTPTGEAESGTVEEIKRHVASGKPAMLYFSAQPVVEGTADLQQLESLKRFRAWCQTQGLVETFYDEAQFKEKLKSHVQLALYKNAYLKPIFAGAEAGASSTSLTPPQEPASETAAVASTLSPEASALLLEASRDPGGTLLAISMLSGRVVQAGQRQFGDMNDRRSLAKWEYGLQQLQTLGLIELVSTQGKRDQVFEINHRGFEVSNYIERKQ